MEVEKFEDEGKHFFLSVGPSETLFLRGRLDREAGGCKVRLLPKRAPLNWTTFKRRTEEQWLSAIVRPNILGFQIQPGTKWNEGLSAQEIASVEQLLGFSFPSDYKELLQTINGLDQDSIDVHGNDGRPYSYASRYYKYPDDWEGAQWLIEHIAEFRDAVDEALTEFGLDPQQVAGFIPIYGHRAVVAFQDIKLSPVISIMGHDVIVYGADLIGYLQNEFHI